MDKRGLFLFDVMMGWGQFIFQHISSTGRCAVAILFGIMRLWSASLGVTGTINQASGFNEGYAWSSLAGVATEQITQNFSAWEEGGEIHFSFSLTGGGPFSASNQWAPRNHLGVVFVTQAMSRGLDWRVDFEPALSLVWSAGSVAGSGWYTSTYVNGGRIERFSSFLDSTEDGSGWLAGVLIQGSATPAEMQFTRLPEPGGLLGFLVLAIATLRQRRGVFS